MLPYQDRARELRDSMTFFDRLIGRVRNSTLKPRFRQAALRPLEARRSELQRELEQAEGPLFAHCAEEN